ncbi:MAG: PilZ domain-containing protein [Pseudomonadota bacterium]
MSEKRRHQRLDVNLPVTLRHDGRLIPATALNISCGGMFIRANDPGLKANASVEIIFDLGARQKDLSMRGRITHVVTSADATDAGVQFTNLFSVSHKAIEEYLGQNLN